VDRTRLGSDIQDAKVRIVGQHIGFPRYRKFRFDAPTSCSNGGCAGGGAAAGCGAWTTMSAAPTAGIRRRVKEYRPRMPASAFSKF
jgi:hypothetical protein